MNNDTQRNFNILIAGSVFAGMLVGPALAQSPCEAANETQAALDSEIFKGVADMVFKIPASDELNSPKQDHFLYLADYVYSEVPPDRKPADTLRDSLKDVPVGTPVEEIKRASDAFGLDFNFMMAVAKIESDFDPKQRTGSYIGLFQLNNYEFREVWVWRYSQCSR